MAADSTPRPQVVIPRRDGSPLPVARRAVRHSICDGPVRCAEEHHIPLDVAEELGLQDGGEIVVFQRPILHTDDAKLARLATNEEGVAEPMDLLQAVIDLTVADSNISIHPPKGDHVPYSRVYVRDMDAPATAWWLYAFLGAARVMVRIQTASGVADAFKKKSPASSQAKTETRSPSSASGRSS